MSWSARTSCLCGREMHELIHIHLVIPPQKKRFQRFQDGISEYKLDLHTHINNIIPECIILSHISRFSTIYFWRLLQHIEIIVCSVCADDAVSSCISSPSSCPAHHLMFPTTDFPKRRWSSLRENLEETMRFPMKYRYFMVFPVKNPCAFPLKTV